MSIKPETRGLVPKEKSLFFGDKNNGLPIGNLTSQFFANVYLNELNHYVLEELGFSRYARYVDDFVILDEDRIKLQRAIDEIGDFLNQKLRLRLCIDKTVLLPTERGIDFLGYYLKPTHTLIRRKVVKRFKKKLFKAKLNKRSKEDGFLCLEDISMIQSYLGHFIHANSYNLRKKLMV